MGFLEDLIKQNIGVANQLNEGIEDLSPLEKADLDKLKSLIGELAGSLAATGMGDDEISDSLMRTVGEEIKYSLSQADSDVEENAGEELAEDGPSSEEERKFDSVIDLADADKVEKFIQNSILDGKKLGVPMETMIQYFEDLFQTQLEYARNL